MDMGLPQYLFEGRYLTFTQPILGTKHCMGGLMYNWLLTTRVEILISPVREKAKNSGSRGSNGQHLLRVAMCRHRAKPFTCIELLKPGREPVGVALSLFPFRR